MFFSEHLFFYIVKGVLEDFFFSPIVEILLKDTVVCSMVLQFCLHITFLRQKVQISLVLK